MSGNLVQMEIARERYLKRLIARKHDGFVKVVTGIRRCGKMTLRRHEIDFIVNLGLRKIYIQSAYDMDEPGKAEQEKTSLKLSGDFFQKVIVEKGYRKLMQDGDGVWRVGIIPFLLEEGLLSGVDLLGGKSLPVKENAQP